MIREGWFSEHLESIENTPEYVATGLMLEIMDVFCKRMDQLEISQSTLASKIEKSQPYVSKMLNQGTNMTLHTLAMFSIALNMDINAPTFTPWEEDSSSVDMPFVSQSQKCDLGKSKTEEYPIEKVKDDKDDSELANAA